MNTYTAITKKIDEWWVGWIQEIPGVNCQEKTHEELIESLKEALKDILDMNRRDARENAEFDYNEELISILAELENETSRITSSSERVFLAELEGGCQAPAGAYTEMNLNDDEFQIFGFVSSLDGKRYLIAELRGKVSESKSLATELAQILLAGGGREILSEIRQGGI